MSPSNRPTLSLDIEYQIEIAKNQIHTHYWPRLEQMQELTQEARSQYQVLRQSLAQPSPRSPQALRLLLCQYGSSLFESEATHFPDSQELEHWLKKLSENIVDGILQRVA
jgi:hypothetical protein